MSARVKKSGSRLPRLIVRQPNLVVKLAPWFRVILSTGISDIHAHRSKSDVGSEVGKAVFRTVS
jgi:hypothetical protein